MYERCRDELLTQYIDTYRGASVEGGTGDSTFWKSPPRGGGGGMHPQLRAITQTGLSKEVLYVVGMEYRRVVRYFDASEAPSGVGFVKGEGKGVSLPRLIISRVQDYLTEVGPHRWQRKYTKLRQLVKIRGSTFKNSESMVDMAWYMGVEELERTAYEIAFAILFDPQLSEEEVWRRREALLALSELFIHHGQPYKGANPSTIDQLMNSIREYQHQREQKSN
ncbi:unnamed protein product [Phytomonas sp. EM1]|nr:unnamed protein product [Phytomonas sp. EM1]|eukprot:CCW65148.1 unnamed protein product [Phytomonas sp. isolate EM1]